MSTTADWRSRILDDGEDRESWLLARVPVIGASDVKQYAKIESVDRYLAAKIKPRTFYGNELTESGHRWEPMILAYLGVPENKALVHSPDNPGFACTPDGISDDDPFTLAEAKTRHGVIRPAPDTGEWRQLAFQFVCFPEAERILFGTLTVLRDENGSWEARKNGYASLEVTRNNPRIVKATEQIMPIAEKVLAALGEAQRALKEVPF